MPGVRTPGSTSAPRSISGTPLHRWAAAGAKMSRPANVAPADCELVLGVRQLDRAFGTAGHRHGRCQETVVGSDHHAGTARDLDRDGTAVGADARIDDREHDARRHVPDASGERECSGANVVRRDLMGEVDDADVRRDVADHGLHDADELVAVAVVGQERHGVVAPRRRTVRHRVATVRHCVALSFARVIERHATGRDENGPGRDEGRCQPPDGTSPVGASGGKTTGASQRASL